MAVFTAATRAAMLAGAGPASVSRKAWLPSATPPITRSVAVSGNVTVLLTAKPVWLKVRPPLRLALTRAEALFTTDST